MPRDERRRQLIDVAIDLFSRRGFNGTTTKEIAEAAGVTEAVIFRHFATKDDLYKAILNCKTGEKTPEEWMAEAQAFMDARDDEGLFRLIVTSFIEFHRTEPRFERLMTYAALEGHTLALMHHEQVHLPIRAKLEKYIAGRQREGALRKGNPGVILFAVAGIAQFYAVQKYVYRVKQLPVSESNVIDSFMEVLMNGLRTTQAKK